MMKPETIPTLTVHMGPDGKLARVKFPEDFTLPMRVIEKNAAGEVVHDEVMHEPPSSRPRRPLSDEWREGLRAALDEAPETDDPDALALRAEFEEMIRE